MLFFITIDKVIYIIEIIIDRTLYIVLFFLFINGLFCVSAGASIPIITTSGMNIISFIKIGIVRFIQIYGVNIKNKDEDIRQSILLFACTPNAVSLIPLNVNNKSITSLNIPKIIEIIIIKINFVIVRYKPSKPYFILSLSFSENYFKKQKKDE